MNLNSGSTNYLVYDFIKKNIVKIFRVCLVCLFISLSGMFADKIVADVFLLSRGELDFSR